MQWGHKCAGMRSWLFDMHLQKCCTWNAKTHYLVVDHDSTGHQKVRHQAGYPQPGDYQACLETLFSNFPMYSKRSGIWIASTHCSEADLNEADYRHHHQEDHRREDHHRVRHRRADDDPFRDQEEAREESCCGVVLSRSRGSLRRPPPFQRQMRCY